ncbi:hypothetical protein RFI_09588, partial [Reticulomyxa filosa]
QEKKELKAEYLEIIALIEQLQNQLNLLMKERQKLNQRMKELIEVETKQENRALIEKMKGFVKENEQLKKQEKTYKEEWKVQATEFQSKLQEIDEHMNNENDEENQRLIKIEKLYESDSKKLNKIRQALAEKNQELSGLTRQLESYPLRAELLQYEKRFVELYSLTNERLKETKKYFHLYNSLNDVHSSISDEVKLLEQIQEEFPSRVKNESLRVEFVSSLDKMISNLDQIISNSEGQLNQVLEQKNKISQDYNQVLSAQRKYYMSVKEFQDACNVNVALAQKIEIFEKKLEELQSQDDAH